MTHDPRSLPTLAESDYEAIELAVMETARGRWFLREFAARIKMWLDLHILHTEPKHLGPRIILPL
jgi:vancomycin permeability regulator SanA